jgi:hypothetical protein
MNLNPIDFNYIDGENIYPLQEYVDEQLNNLVSNKIYTSNIYVTTTKKLNEVIYYSTSNLNIQNNTPAGEIYFKTYASYPDDINKIGTIIDFTGKLQVYHNYNALQPTFTAGYYDVESELLQLKADGISTDIQLTGLEATTISQQGQITNITNQLMTVETRLFFITESIFENATYEQFSNVLSSCNFVQLQDRYVSLRSTIRQDANNIYTRAYSRGIIISAICGAAGAGIAAVSSFYAYQRASNVLYSNTATTITEKDTIYNAGLNDEIQSYSNFSISTSNLNILNGFINSNVATAQIIPNINTSAITINNTGSATYSLINFSNATNNSSGYIGLGGIVSGYHNNNLLYYSPKAHIFNTPGQTSLSIPAFAINASACVGVNINPSAYPLYRFSVDGDVYIHNAALRTNSIIYNGTEISSTLNNYVLKSGSTMTGALTTNSIIYNSQELSTTLNNYLLLSGGTLSDTLLFNTGLYANPGPYPNGFDGDRIVLNAGIGTNGYPYSVGINTDVFWHSAPATASYKFYSGATNTATLNNAGLLTLPSINATTSITTPSIIYNGTELSTTVGNYLLKSGGTMTGQLAITANSASSLISLTNTGTVGQGILQTNNLGGFARLTYYNSGAGGYYTANYVLEASSNSAAIIMNTGGATSNSIPRFILNSSGNIGIGISNPSNKLEVAGNISQTGNTFTIGNSTGGVILNLTDIVNAAWQIKTGGYNLSFFNNEGGTFSNRVVFMRYGNVGIGTDNAASLLHIKGTNPALTVMAQGGSGASSTLNLTTYNNTTNAPNCSLSATDTGDYGATFQIKQKLAGADTNGQFTSFIMDKDGNAAFGNTTYASTKLYVNGKARFEDVVTFTTGNWNMSRDGVYRTYYGANSTSYYSCGNDANTYAHYFMKSATQSYGAIMIMKNDGNTDIYGNVMINAATPYLNIKSSSEGDKSIIYLGTPYVSGSALKCAIIAEGINSYSRSKLHFCLDNTADNSTTYNASLANSRMNIDYNGNVNITGLTRSRNYHNYGTTLNYRTSFDGTNGPGWYMTTNAWWQDISTVSYLCVAITCLGQNAVWFGRLFLGQGGGFYQTICDMRNPNGGTNTIDVADVWNSGGVNALKITINNAVYGGQFNVKFSG